MGTYEGRRRHGHRPETYGPFDYFGEFGNVVSAMQQKSLSVSNNLIGPSLATGDWTPESELPFGKALCAGCGPG